MKEMREKKGTSLLEFVDNYVVLDIETTGLDTRYDSIIELGAIRYQSDKETARFQSFVDPEFCIPEFITQLTGISNEMVCGAPKIEDILPDFLNFIGNAVVVGHNVHFDINFIYDKAANIGSVFSNSFIDTLRISRRVYKDLPNHKLSTICDCLKIPQPEEHRAIADCIRTQACYAAMKQAVNDGSATLINPYVNYNAIAKTIHAETDDFDPDHPLYGKYVAFTGTLQCVSRKAAMQATANVGGICCDGVRQETNYLVLGNNDYCKSIKDGKSAKQKKAEKMQLDGFDIQVISERVFYEMLGANDMLRQLHQMELRDAALASLEAR